MPIELKFSAPKLIPSEPPMNKIFDALRGIWKEQTGKRYHDLAVFLSSQLEIVVTPQKLSQWATGSDNRKPPWKAIYLLMDQTGYRLVIELTGAKLQSVPAKKGR